MRTESGAGGTGKISLRILQLIALALDRDDLIEEIRAAIFGLQHPTGPPSP